MRVLLSIKPEYALQIFDGIKKYEYRRVIFKKPVEKIIVYASSPVQLVIGEFQIDELISTSIDELWEQTQEYSGISKEYYYRYFSNVDEGYAIKIGEVKRYATPKTIQEVFGINPPQSFAYV
ncbi:MAG: hypothetical protein WC837_14835 [Bellilinea sp.]